MYLTFSNIPSIETKAQERDLIHQAQSGDRNARDKLLLSHVPFVIRWVERLVGENHPMFADLVQEGILGDMTGIERYNLDKYVVRYSTYGYWWIRDALNVYLNRELNWEWGIVPNEFRPLYAGNRYDDHPTLIDSKDNCGYISPVIVSKRDTVLEFQEAGYLQGIDLLNVMLDLVNGEVSAKQKEILRLYYREEWTHKRIGEILGHSDRWIATLKHRALDEIRLKVKEITLI